MESDDGDAPLLAYIAKGYALLGQGNSQKGMEAIDFALRNCNEDARSFIELIKVR